MIEELGKIKSFDVCIDGRDDDMIGVRVVLECNGGVVCDFKGCRFENIKDSDLGLIHTRLGGILFWVSKMLRDAKKTKISDMVGVPIKATFEGPDSSPLSSWRVLTEVI